MHLFGIVMLGGHVSHSKTGIFCGCLSLACLTSGARGCGPRESGGGQEGGRAAETGPAWGATQTLIYMCTGILTDSTGTQQRCPSRS
jgi:hypothetical protein